MKQIDIKPPKSFVELFNIILMGNREDSRIAARQVRKLLYSSCCGGGRDEIGKIIESAPSEYCKISEQWRQENFTIAISVMHFLRDRDKRPDLLFPWLFYLLFHENGYIRHSAVRMIENELGPLTAHIRIPDFKQGKLEVEQSDNILMNMFVSLNDMSIYLWKPMYKRYKYVSSLPAGPYKSVQMVFSSMEYDCGHEYMKSLREKFTK